MASKKSVGQGSIPDPDALYQKATAAELSQDYDAAFKLYISAAQSFLQVVRSSPAVGASGSSRYKERAGTCLARAEAIKSARKEALKATPSNPFSDSKHTTALCARLI